MLNPAMQLILYELGDFMEITEFYFFDLIAFPADEMMMIQAGFPA